MSKPAAFQPQAWAAATWPLGAHVVPARRTTTFAVYSRRATRVLLELYARATGEDAVAGFELARGADDVWRAELSGVGPGALYGLRAWGPCWPFDPAWRRGGSGAGFVADLDADGNRFNPNKLLFDPYARELSHEPVSDALHAAGLDGGIYGTGGAPYRGAARREADTGRWAPKGIVIQDRTATGRRPRVKPQDAAIYEAHVRNLTCHPSAATLRATLAGIPGFDRVKDVPPELAGTYAGAALMAPYVRALGFTAIELLPVQEVANTPAARREGKYNHWGYMTQGFFAPDREYAHDRAPGGPTREFKELVRAFHEQGVEVYLDVVFNHTAEGGNWTDGAGAGLRDTMALTSLAGLDTSAYYVLTDDGVLVQGATGCGNQLDGSSAAAQGLVLDALRYWIDEMGVDGFRFDLAPVLGRTPEAWQRDDWEDQRRFFPKHPLLAAIQALGEEKQVEMIAEAWDLWGNELGNFPSGWAEWNGRFRDAVRGYLKGDGNTCDFMAMMNGDWEHYSDQGGAQKSVNFVTAHDGFTLLDLVSYQAKENEALRPPFGPSDGGTDDNRSWDSGGDHALRRQRMRNFWTVLFFSRGVPLATSGDELGRTQNGNNNPWALDGPALWNNWAMAATSAPTALPPDPADPAAVYDDNFGQAAGPPDQNPFFRFAAFVANLRRHHRALRQRSYGNFVLDDGDVSYFFATPDGAGAPGPRDRCLRVHVDASGVGDADFVLFLNMWTAPTSFTPPPAGAGRRWARIIDTAAWAEAEANRWEGAAAAEIAGGYLVQPWSVVVLQEVRR